MNSENGIYASSKISDSGINNEDLLKKPFDFRRDDETEKDYNLQSSFMLAF
jgi:hypothetical protein